MKEARHKRPDRVSLCLSEMPKTGKLAERGKKISSCQGEWGVTATRHVMCFGEDEYILKLNSRDGCTTL